MSEPAGRRTGRIVAGWYVVALVVYVTAGYFFKPVLMNWTFGPLFLLLVLYVVPTSAGWLWSRLRSGAAR